MRAWRHLLCCTRPRGKELFFTTETQRHREKPGQKNRKSLDKKILGTSRPPTRHRQVRHRIVPRVEITLRWIHRAAKPDGGGPCVWLTFLGKERTWRGTLEPSQLSARRLRCISSLARVY